MAGDLREITSGLEFPEGPVVLADGSVVVVEIRAGRVTRVRPDGKKEVVAETGGGPNGAALGPDGKLYVVNNGGFQWHEAAGLVIPGEQPEDYSGGRVERIDLDSGKVEVLYTESDGRPLRGPNDIVFDEAGGFWFTDHGKVRERERDRTGIHYAKTDGSEIHEVIFPSDGPNGIGLSPDGKRLYAAETMTGRLFAWNVTGPGKVAPPDNPFSPTGAELVAGLPGLQYFDSLAVEEDGNVCVATLLNGGITVIAPDGTIIEHVPTGDPLTTNIAFGGDDLRTAYITLSGTGRLVATEWPRPGLRLNFQQTG